MRRCAVAFCDCQRLPHAQAEEHSDCAAAAADGLPDALIKAMIAEPRTFAERVGVGR